MSLISALSVLTATRPVRLSVPDKLQVECEKIKQTYPDTVALSSKKLDELISELQSRLETWNWEGFHQGDIDVIARGVFAGMSRPDANVISFLRNEAEVSTRPSFLNAVAEAYLESWHPQDAQTSFLADCLIKRCDHLPDRWKRLLQLLPEFLELVDGPTKLAQRMLGESKPYQWLQDKGVADPHGPGFMNLAYEHYIDILPAITTPTRLQSLVSWLSPSHGQILTGNLAKLSLEKLLSPWHQKDPEALFKNELIQAIMGLYGDPRRDHQEIWLRVSNPSRGVILRWLAGKSMEAFMAIVSETEDSHMWEPRRAFWMALYEQGLVDEAWVALPAKGQRIARVRADQTGDQTYLGFGRQVSTGAKRNTSLLIMRFGEKIVVEGSHNYRVHVFRSQMKNRPELYQTAYDADEMKLANHHPDTYYHVSGWQNKVRRAIL